jgi:hypothetical protein
VYAQSGVRGKRKKSLEIEGEMRRKILWDKVGRKGYMVL